MVLVGGIETHERVAICVPMQATKITLYDGTVQLTCKLLCELGGFGAASSGKKPQFGVVGSTHVFHPDPLFGPLLDLY